MAGPQQDLFAGRSVPDGTVAVNTRCLVRTQDGHVIVLDEVHLRRILAKYFEYYNEARCHLPLAGDAPKPRGVQGQEMGDVIEFPAVGGLHHRYARAAA